MNKVRTTLFLGLIMLMAATTLTIGLVIGSFGGYQFGARAVEPPEIEDAQAEYYRGVYDICIQQTRRSEFCLKTVRRLTQSDWYEKPSPGFEWPPTTSDNKVASVK